MALPMIAPPPVRREEPDLPAEGGPWPAQGEWTYEDYLRLPDDGRRYEIIQGVLYVTAAPRFNHQYVVGELFAALRAYVRERGLGVVIPAPFEVHLGERIRPVQPDLIFLRAERQPSPEAGHFEGAPDLVVEVLSPSTARTDRVVKFWVYEQSGVPEYWIVDPHARSVEVYLLREGIYTLHGQYVGSETLTSPTFPELALPVQSLFPELT
ncbi:MAG TPA: Uma2 family endonuclease [Chloroflexi bacterium]|nr:Uma2 family endonuclease [Chloroflexota bacterium]